MALPHPHGNASGEIAHNSNYDTGVAPGSTGGKFIGFGEQGTTAIANRPHWALSENIDYLYDIISADRAIPAVDLYTVSGGTGNAHQITDDVWCGDAGYPAQPEGLYLLFSVLDDQYNELVDANGLEVVVGIVRDATNVTDEYKNGFITNPTLNFYTRNPDGTLNGAYTIPDTTEVRVMYGSKGSLENLPVDAFTKFKVQSGEELPAGAFLANGTIPMTGNADWDGNSILNLAEARGESGADLLLRSLQGLNFQDQYAGPISFSESGQSSLLGTLNTSLLGTTNSNTQQVKQFGGNRTLVKGGTISFTGASGTITLPSGMVVSSNGEAVNVGSQNYVATSGVRWGVIDASGTFVERTSLAAILSTDVPVTYYNWNGVDTFTVSKDVRWLSNGVLSTRPITVSSSRADADFDDLQTACDVIDAISNRGLDGFAGVTSAVIEILDRVIITDTVTLPSVPITLRGAYHNERYGSSVPTPRVQLQMASAVNALDCNLTAHRIENLNFMAFSGSTAPIVIANMGSYSVCENVMTLYQGVNIGTGWGWTSGSVEDITLKSCSYNGTGTPIDTTGATSVIRMTVLDFTTTNSAGIDVSNAFEVIFERCKLGEYNNALSGYAIHLGPDSRILNSFIRGTTAGVYISDDDADTGSQGTRHTYEISGCRVMGQSGACIDIVTTSTADPTVVIRHNTFTGIYGIDLTPSLASTGYGAFIVEGNTFTGIGSGRYGIDSNNTRNITVSGNHFLDCDGTPIRVQTQGNAIIAYNVIESFSATTGAILVVDGSALWNESFIIQGNSIMNSNGTTGGIGVVVQAMNCTVIGNHFKSDTASLDYGVKVEVGNGCKVVGNTFEAIGNSAIWVDTADKGPLVANNSIRVGAQTGALAEVTISSGEGTTVVGNLFYSDRSSNMDKAAIWALSPKCVIDNNALVGVVGYHAAGDSYVIRIAGNSSRCCNNFLYQCGDAQAAAITASLIAVDNYAVKVCGNVIEEPYCPQSASSNAYLIYLKTGASKAQVNDNAYRDNSSGITSRLNTGNFSFIYGTSSTHQVQCNGNSTHYSGSSFALDGSTIALIFLEGEQTQFCNNYFGAYTRTGTILVHVACWVIANEQVSIGNLNYSDVNTTFDERSGGGANGIVLGNASFGTGATAVDVGFTTTGNI